MSTTDRLIVVDTFHLIRVIGQCNDHLTHTKPYNKHMILVQVMTVVRWNTNGIIVVYHHHKPTQYRCCTQQILPCATCVVVCTYSHYTCSRPVRQTRHLCLYILIGVYSVTHINHKMFLDSGAGYLTHPNIKLLLNSATNSLSVRITNNRLLETRFVYTSVYIQYVILLVL